MSEESIGEAVDRERDRWQRLVNVIAEFEDRLVLGNDDEAIEQAHDRLQAIDADMQSLRQRAEQAERELEKYRAGYENLRVTVDERDAHIDKLERERDEALRCFGIEEELAEERGERLARLTEAARVYSRPAHHEHCDKLDSGLTVNEKQCNCGFDDLDAALSEQARGEVGEPAPADMTDAKMNAAVAERVMGWIQDDSPVWLDEESSVMRRVAEWRPTTDPRDSRTVEERMRELGYVLYTYSGPYGHAAAFTQWSHDAPKFNDDDVCDSLDRAICEAALEAVSQ